MAGDVAVRQRDREQHDPRDEADRGPGQQHNKPSPPDTGRTAWHALDLRRRSHRGPPQIPQQLADLPAGRSRQGQLAGDGWRPWRATAADPRYASTGNLASAGRCVLPSADNALAPEPEWSSSVKEACR
jgi:hypothetical protein